MTSAASLTRPSLLAQTRGRRQHGFARLRAMAQTTDSQAWPDAEPAEVPAEVLARLRETCGRLPDVVEEGSSYGARWRIRKRAFLTVRTRLLGGVPTTRLQFRSGDPEFQFLVESGPPFARAGWGSDV